MTDSFGIGTAHGVVTWAIVVWLVPHAYRPSLIKPLAGWTKRRGDLLFQAADGDFPREAARVDAHNEWMQLARDFRLWRGLRVGTVGSLQDALRFLTYRRTFNRSAARQMAFDEGSGAGSLKLQYGGWATKLAAPFQRQQKLTPSGEVDERTVEVLNVLLDALYPFAEDGGARSYFAQAGGALRE